MVRQQVGNGNTWCLRESEPTLPAKKQKIKKIMEEMEMEKIRNFFKDESGANMVEYALLVALIGVALIVTIQGLTGGIQGTFQKAQAQLG
jgi:Flp pilus assembly pilin Flp